MSALRQYSVQAGRHSNFLAGKKCSNPLIFKFFGKLGKGNYAKGIMIYDDLSCAFRSRMAEIYYSLLEEKRLSEFYRSTAIKGLYRRENVFIQSIQSLAFRSTSETTSLEVFRKMHLISKEFEKQKANSA